VVNSDKIKGRMREMHLTQADVAKYIGVKPPTINQKINNIRPINIDEAERMCDLLKIDCSDFGNYFFA